VRGPPIAAVAGPAGGHGHDRIERRYRLCLAALRRPCSRDVTQADLLRLRGFIRKYEHTHIGRPAPVETEVINLDEARARLRPYGGTQA
jgi:hypothetical protein